MKRISLHLVTVLSLFILSSTSLGQIGGTAGSFSRIGFGARGIGMSNAMTAVSKGDIVGYYNPAVVPLSSSRNVAAAFGILALDRKLNFLSVSLPVPPSAGISAGIINSGVSDIDGRDRDGEQTGPLRTSENQVFLSFANQFRGSLSLGITLKLYYHHLFTDVSSTTVGIDFGAALPISRALTIGATVRDINSHYKWDTSELYGQSGNATKDKFPTLYTFGAMYVYQDSVALLSVDIEGSNKSTLIARAGIEIPLLPELAVRGGIDRIDVKEKGNGVRPVFGFTVRRTLGSWVPALHYAFVIEPFAPSPMHMIALSTNF